MSIYLLSSLVHCCTRKPPPFFGRLLGGQGVPTERHTDLLRLQQCAARAARACITLCQPGQAWNQ